jgi:hypothetical protein
VGIFSDPENFDPKDCQYWTNHMLVGQNEI